MTPTKPNEAEAVTEADVAKAERDADDAEALATSLEELVRQGDESITPEQIAAQKNLGAFAKLRSAATERKFKAAKEAQRLAALAAIHDEIHEYGDAVGDALAKLLAACHEANQTFAAAVAAHTAKVQDWRTRAAALDVPEGDNLPMPPAENGRIAIPSGTGGASIRASLLKLGNLNAQSLVSRIADEPHNAEALAEGIRAIAAQRVPGPDAGLVHYQGVEGGTIIGRDKPYTDEEAKRLQLRRLDPKEVWA